MTGPTRPLFPLGALVLAGALLLGVAGCRTPAGPTPAGPAQPSVPVRPSSPAVPPTQAAVFPVMLGIDVLEAKGFDTVVGKRIGLLTHPAGVNRRGESTIDVLRRAPNVRLVALFGPEHGIYGTDKAGANVADTVDRRTGLPVYSLHGANRKPTKAQLAGLDALVIDLQDIGVRSYTFNVVMRYAMEACFESNVEVIILDRPNPLGGLKVDGPLLDREWFSGVGAFRIPYVHGLTMAELAYYAASTPGALPEIAEAARNRGRLTLVPMRGWRREMRWTETGLPFVPTSQYVQDFAAVVGYAMVGLGCEFSGFTHGIGASYPFRGLGFKGVTAEKLAADLTALRVPGVAFRVLPDPANPRQTGVYAELTDWASWNPTELSFQLMRIASRYNAANPFAKLNADDARSFNIHVGSTAWWTALRRDGARVNLEAFLTDWKTQAAAYQQQTRKYWLYQ